MPDKRSGEGAGERGLSQAERADFARRVGELDKELSEARAQQDTYGSPEDNAAKSRGMAMGLRMASELVGAVIVGGLIGYFLDQWLGTQPWLFLVFFFMGFAAGVLNVVRGFTRLQAEIKNATGGDIGRDLPDDDDD